MHRALPGSEYYGGSALSRTDRPTMDPTRRSALAARQRADPGQFPCSLLIRSTEEEPSSIPAASPRLPRSTSPRPPEQTFTRPPRSSRLTESFGPTSRCAPHPAHIRQIEAGKPLRDVVTLVPRVLLSVTLAGPAPSGSADTSRLCQGCSHPHRHLPEQAAPSFTALLRQGQRRRSLTSTQFSSASRRTWIRAKAFR
jgi:hypothetical protein